MDREEEVIESLLRWMRLNPPSVASLKIYLYRESRHGVKIHDRYFGFSVEPSRDESWFAVSVGYGMEAFNQAKRFRCETIIARVRPTEFVEHWKVAQGKCRWLITYSAQPPSLSGWHPHGPATRLRNQMSICVYRKGIR